MSDPRRVPILSEKGRHLRNRGGFNAIFASLDPGASAPLRWARQRISSLLVRRSTHCGLWVCPRSRYRLRAMLKLLLREIYRLTT